MTSFITFRPPWWATGPHQQTILARLLRPSRGPALVRERIATPDGDFLDLDWSEDPAAPLVVVLHGLEGSARSRYALETYRLLAGAGCAAVGVNFRSCSGEPNRAARLYHSGETGDLGFVLQVLANRFPGRALAAIGFSLGGNVLLKYLAERHTAGLPEMVRAAVAVSVPYDLSAGADVMEHGFARLYVRNLLRKLRRKVRAKESRLRGRIDVAGALRARTFRAFDEAATAPLHGFASAEDYYRRSSSGPRLHEIGVPTRLIHALDDPFLPRHAVPLDAMRANPALDPVITKRGGHVGFLQVDGTGPTFWAEQQAAEFIAGKLGVIR